MITACEPLLKWRFALLLISLAALLLLSPPLDDGARGEGALALLFSVVILGLVTAAGTRRREAAALAVIWLIFTWVRPFGEGAMGEVAADTVLFALCLLCIAFVLRHALAARKVDSEVLCAAISAYVLLGVVWAVAYTVLETLDPGAFRPAIEGDVVQWSNLLYFSFTTLTTLGYGDMVPVSPTARMWTTIQAMGGTLYLAILIARLVGVYQSEPDRRS